MTLQLSDDRGSTIPLILGFFLVALLVSAGAVAAGDAFVQQRDLQDLCDGAAVAAANAVDLAHARQTGDIGTNALRLADVEHAVDSYLSRDGSRSGVQVAASLSSDSTTVSLQCARRSHIAFGALFGKGDGVEHQVSSSARSPIS